MTDTKIAGLDRERAGSLSLVLSVAVLVSLEYVQPKIADAGYQLAGLVVHAVVALLAVALAVADLLD